MSERTFFTQLHVEAGIVYGIEGCMAAVANAICDPPRNFKIAFVYCDLFTMIF